MRNLVLAACVAMLCVATGAPALAQSGTVQIDARAEVAAALYAASATQAAAERAADARLRAAQSEIASLQSQGASARAELIAAQERYVADLARRDRAYAQEITVFRAAVTDIVSTPEGTAALARFNAGDEIGALAVLDQLIDVRERARQVRANIETAAERRGVATLALEARDRGRLDTQSAISRYLQVVALDPGFAWDWIELSRLYQRSGNLSAAGNAARSAIAASRNNEEERAARAELGTVLQNQGDLNGAAAEFHRVLDTSRRQLLQAPNDPAALNDVSLALSFLAGVLDRQGERAAARAARAEALQLSSQASTANNESLPNRRSLAIRLAEQANSLLAQGNMEDARRQLEEAVAIFRTLIVIQPEVLEAQRDLALTLLFLGDAIVSDLSNPIANAEYARSRYEEGLRILRDITRSDPTNHQARADLSAGLTKVGDALYVLGDFPEALAVYEEALRLDLDLVSADPENAELRRSLSIDHEKLAAVEAARENWSEAARHQFDAVAVLRQLVASRPTNPQFTHDLRSAEQLLNQYRSGRARPAK